MNRQHCIEKFKIGFGDQEFLRQLKIIPKKMQSIQRYTFPPAASTEVKKNKILTDTGLSWPQKASRIFARLFSRAVNKNQVVLNFFLPDIDIVNNLLTINKIKIRNKISP